MKKFLGYGVWSGADRRTEIRINRKTDFLKQFYKMIHTEKNNMLEIIKKCSLPSKV